MIIYQEKESEAADAPVNVKVFVEYVAAEGAQRARNSLDQRFFGGNQILANIYDQAHYDNNDLSLWFSIAHINFKGPTNFIESHIMYLVLPINILLYSIPYM